jgi:hypothetical protein
MTAGTNGRQDNCSLCKSGEPGPSGPPCLALAQRSATKTVGKLGWETGIEPATFGATDRRSTS